VLRFFGGVLVVGDSALGPVFTRFLILQLWVIFGTFYLIDIWNPLPRFPLRGDNALPVPNTVGGISLAARGKLAFLRVINRC